MLEKITRAHYEAYFEGVADMEPSWDELPDSAKARFKSAMRTALLVALQERAKLVGLD